MTENYTTGAQYLIQENGKTIGGCQSFDFEVSQEVEDLEEMGDLYDLGHIVTSVKVSGRMSTPPLSEPGLVWVSVAG